jgi:hypothetical protein
MNRALDALYSFALSLFVTKKELLNLKSQIL